MNSRGYRSMCGVSEKVTFPADRLASSVTGLSETAVGRLTQRKNRVGVTPTRFPVLPARPVHAFGILVGCLTTCPRRPHAHFRGGVGSFRSGRGMSAGGFGSASHVAFGSRLRTTSICEARSFVLSSVGRFLFGQFRQRVRV